MHGIAMFLLQYAVVAHALVMLPYSLYTHRCLSRTRADAGPAGCMVMPPTAVPGR